MRTKAVSNFNIMVQLPTIPCPLKFDILYLNYKINHFQGIRNFIMKTIQLLRCGLLIFQ